MDIMKHCIQEQQIDVLEIILIRVVGKKKKLVAHNEDYKRNILYIVYIFI